MIGFEKAGQDPVTGEIIWRLMEENGTEHKHKFFQDSIHESPVGIRRRRVVDIEHTALDTSENAMNRTDMEH